ncbi:MAG: Re/Si-specific NAD(P)(+) transhydrogenase subunit alpha [Pseudomonadales bacterium]|nr:Re/Si-specific NAD(P)(+) transhydrogenase subunit alpha [Pseudomonadales bacterium]
MRIVVPTEIIEGENRVAASPETVNKLVTTGHDVVVQTSAGLAAGVSDELYQQAGASIVNTPDQLYEHAEIVLKVRAPRTDEITMMPRSSILIGMLEPFNEENKAQYASQGLNCFALESLPRISREQVMDVLSSQSNIAGYKAVLVAAYHYPRFFPMLMTAAGTVRPAKILVLGAGVAGLMAISTAKRMGAVVSSFDVRPAVKEQVESLGAKFIEVPLEEHEQAETSGGYATEMSEDYQRRQGELVHEVAIKSDIIITTALIPGRPAPVLLQAETVEQMRAGSVVVDLAAESGGNCPLTEKDKTVVKHGVILIGNTNLPSTVAADASELYARNIYNFLELLIDKESGQAMVDSDDEIIRGGLICREGQIRCL